MISIHGDAAVLALTQGCVAIIDASDVAAVSNRLWCAVRCGESMYAASSAGPTRIYLHRWLVNAPADSDVDHRNRLTLDNRRSNLRICSASQNIANAAKRRAATKSMFKGVSSSGAAGWRASMTVDGRYYHLGSFRTEIEAALAYDQAAKQAYGDFARLNFPNESDVPHGEREASREEFRNVEKFRRKLGEIFPSHGARHAVGR